MPHLHIKQMGTIPFSVQKRITPVAVKPHHGLNFFSTKFFGSVLWGCSHRVKVYRSYR